MVTRPTLTEANAAIQMHAPFLRPPGLTEAESTVGHRMGHDIRKTALRRGNWKWRQHHGITKANDA